MKGLFVRLTRSEEGQDLIEYALLAAFISLTVTASVLALGNRLNDWYEGLDAKLKAVS
jgi:Flp pilus assembly pilin Flp